MFKKRVFSSGILVILLIAIVFFSLELFGCTAWTSPGGGTGGTGGTGGGTGGSTGTGGGTAGGGSVGGMPSPAVSDWELPIIVSITGTDSDAGTAAAWGFDYGIKVVNEQGGIRGLPVKITIRDAASSNATVTTELGTVTADALISLGPPTESLYKAGEKTFFDAGMPVVGAATDTSSREALSPFAISCISDPSKVAYTAMDAWMHVEKFTKVCIIYSSAFSDRVALAEETLLTGGKEVSQKIELGTGAFDAASEAEKAFAAGADAYYIDMVGEDALRVIKQLRRLAGDNASKQIILCGSGAADKNLLEADTEGALQGVRVWATIDPGKDAEKRKMFDDAFAKNVGDHALYSLAVDYYQSALMLKEAIDSLGLTGAPEALAEEREKLATYLYNTGRISTDHGDFVIQSGNKLTAPKLYKITEKGFQS